MTKQFAVNHVHSPFLFRGFFPAVVRFAVAEGRVGYPIFKVRYPIRTVSASEADSIADTLATGHEQAIPTIITLDAMGLPGIS